MVDGGIRHDWCQHIGRNLHFGARMGGKHGHDLSANVLGLYRGLCGGGYSFVAIVLPT